MDLSEMTTAAGAWTPPRPAGPEVKSQTYRHADSDQHCCNDGYGVFQLSPNEEPELLVPVKPSDTCPTASA